MECRVLFFGHCDLELVSRIILSRAYPIFLGRNHKLSVLMHLGMVESHIPFWGHSDLDF